MSSVNLSGSNQKRVKELELLAAKIRRNVLDICMQRGGYAGQGVALADVGATGSTEDNLGVEPVPEKFETFGFAARRINGNSVEEILLAFEQARNTRDKPFAIICDTRLFVGIDCLQAALPMTHYVAVKDADWEAGLSEINAKINALS